MQKPVSPYSRFSSGRGLRTLHSVLVLSLYSSGHCWSSGSAWLCYRQEGCTWVQVYRWIRQQESSLASSQHAAGKWGGWGRKEECNKSEGEDFKKASRVLTNDPDEEMLSGGSLCAVQSLFNSHKHFKTHLWELFLCVCVCVCLFCDSALTNTNNLPPVIEASVKTFLLPGRFLPADLYQELFVWELHSSLKLRGAAVWGYEMEHWIIIIS